MADELKDMVKAEVDRQVAERSADSLEAQFRKEAAAIASGPRPSMDRVRKLQAEYREKGLSEEALDLNPKGGVPKGNTVRDWFPPGR